MKIYSFSILLILFLIAPPIERHGKVVAVLDGDTIEILDSNNKTYRIRLSGIDCPEKAQAFGQKAKQFTSDLCFGKSVKVIVHSTDRYGREIGDIVLSDGTVVNEELVGAGFAWHYKQYSSDAGLAKLEVEARKKKLGLWADPNPIPPWEFRRKK